MLQHAQRGSASAGLLLLLVVLLLLLLPTHHRGIDCSLRHLLLLAIAILTLGAAHHYLKCIAYKASSCCLPNCFTTVTTRYARHVQLLQLVCECGHANSNSSNALIVVRQERGLKCCILRKVCDLVVTPQCLLGFARHTLHERSPYCAPAQQPCAAVAAAAAGAAAGHHCHHCCWHQLPLQKLSIPLHVCDSGCCRRSLCYCFCNGIANSGNGGVGCLHVPAWGTNKYSMCYATA